MVISNPFTPQQIVSCTKIGADYLCRRGLLFDYGQIDEVATNAVIRFAGRPSTDGGMKDLIDWLKAELLGSMDRAFYDV